MGDPDCSFCSVSAFILGFYISQSKKTFGDLNVKCSLLSGTRQDQTWWVANFAKTNGRFFFPKVADLEIFSDASLSGWGASCNGQTTWGPWTNDDADRHINELKLLALLSFISVNSHRSMLSRTLSHVGSRPGWCPSAC